MSPTPQTPPTDRPLTAGDWIEWHGGENPVPGQWIYWKSATGAEFGPVLSNEVCGFGFPHMWGAHGIIAYRTARPATSAASEGAVGLAASEVGAWIAKRDAEFEDRLADLTITPDVSSLDELGRSIFGALTDCPSMSIDKQSDFVARALWPALASPPVSERERELEGALRVALAEYDHAVSTCPINGPKKQADTTAPCKRCGATSAEPCGREGGASGAFIAAVRALVLKEPV